MIFVGHVYVTGGRSGGRGDSIHYYDGIYQYEKSADIWVFKGRMSGALYGHCMCALEDRLFICGGLQKQSKAMSSMVQYFDIETSQTSIVKELPEARSLSACNM